MTSRGVSQVWSHEKFRIDLKVSAQNFQLEDSCFLLMHFDTKKDDEQPGQAFEKPWE